MKQFIFSLLIAAFVACMLQLAGNVDDFKESLQVNTISLTAPVGGQNPTPPPKPPDGE